MNTPETTLAGAPVPRHNLPRFERAEPLPDAFALGLPVNLRFSRGLMSLTMTEGSSRHHRFTVAQYYRMAEAGALAPDVRVELIEGEIIDMAPIGSRHAYYVRELDNLLRRAVSDRAVVQCQSPVRLSDISEPQPDLALLKPPAGAYKERHPGAGDSLLLIEVSDSTFRDDRRVKVPLYARHGIPEVWLVDAVECAVHLFRSPLQGSYRQTSIARVGERLVIAALGDVAVDLSDILSS